MTRYFCSIVVAFSLVSCTAAMPPVPLRCAPSMLEPDASVLQTVIRDVVQTDRRVRSDSQIVIYSTTAPAARLKWIRERIRSSPLLDELACRNAERVDLQIAATAPIVFADQAQLRLLFPESMDDPVASWRAFSKAFPQAHGFFNLTLPAYDVAQSEAVVYVEWQGGPLAARGSLVRLTRTVNGWSVGSVQRVWSS